MKNLITSILIIFCSISFGQTVAPIGNNNIVQWHKGGIVLDSAFALPVRERNAIYGGVNGVRYQGRIQVNRSTLIPEYHNGTNWIPFVAGNLSISRIPGLQDSLNSKMGAAVLEKDPNVPAFVKSILIEDISRWNNPTFASVTGKPAAYNSTIALVEGLQSEINALYAGLSLKMNKADAIDQSQITGLMSSLSDINSTISSLQNSLNSKISVESDPTVSAYAKSLTSFAVIKSSTDQLYKSIGYTPTSADIIASLGYAPYNPLTNPNGYINQSAARSAISLTTTGSGSATYNSSTGVFNIPTVTNTVNSVYGRTGSVVASTGDYNTSQVTELTNLYFTTARVLATSLAGLSTSDATSVTSVDNLVVAIGKLQAQVNSQGFAVNNTSVGLSRSSLNTQYPNAGPKFMVLCPDITLGGAIYVKVTSGASGRWQTISAPPTL